MAPPAHTFPISELPSQIPSKYKNYKEVSRKLPRDFDLKDCELLKITQYTCTTVQMTFEHQLQNPDAPMLRKQCYPFTRLFRRCHEGGIGGSRRSFHVETTAWEGEHKWVPNEKIEDRILVEDKIEGIDQGSGFAKYGSYFWSTK